MKSKNTPDINDQRKNINFQNNIISEEIFLMKETNIIKMGNKQ
jgi:hypothetical protein